VQQFFAILFVLLALWGAVMFLKKKGIAVLSTPLRKQTPFIQQLDRMRLTPQHSIHLLRVEERRLLIAVHPQGVTILEEGARQAGYAASKGGAS
jgi:flagellar biogenesis protein FliO